ncbi:unnamed protein product, partial [marine sediment metagenome]
KRWFVEMELYNYMGYELIEKVINREITIQDVIQTSFDRIEATDNLIHSFVKLSKDKALKKAKEYDIKIQKGQKVGRLYGLP